NHETRATGTASFPKANVATFNNQNGGRGHASDRGRGRGRGFGRDEKIDNFDIDSFGIDILDVDPKDQNDTTQLNVSDILTNE
nr:hypothetical protein CDL12_25305 [Tanacetum cinerariifolium]